MKDTFTLLFDDDTSIDLFDNEYFETTGISGLTSYKATLNKKTLATIPGDTVTDIHVEPRDLTIYFKPNSDNSFSVEEGMRAILDHARKGYSADFQWDKKRSDGTVIHLKARVKFEYIDLPRFEDTLDGEIGLHMEYPFFISETSRNHTLNALNEFEKTVDNGGDYSIGVKIDVRFSGTITDLKIENVTTGESIKLEEISSDIIDIIKIDTRTGNKNVIQNSTGDDLSDVLDLESKWINLIPGENLIRATYTAATGAAVGFIKVEYNEVFV